MSESAAGRDQRRKGLVNMLRRGIYGALLWISQPLNAMAADEGKASEAEPEPRSATIDIQALPAKHFGDYRTWRIGVSTDDPRMAPALTPIAQRLRSRRWQFDRNLPNLRAGIGLDIDLPEAGNLHLNLLPPRGNAANAGQGLRWKVSADETGNTDKLWSIGGTVDRVRSGNTPGEQGEQKIALTPQLILDVDALAGMKGDAKLVLQRGQWRDKESGEDVGQVWQVNLRWRF